VQTCTGLFCFFCEWGIVQLWIPHDWGELVRSKLANSLKFLPYLRIDKQRVMCFHYLYWNKSLLWRNWLKRLFYKSTNRNIMSFFLINLDVNSKTQIYWTFLLKSSAQIRSKLWHLSICFEGDKQTANKPNVQPKHPTNKGPNDQTYRTKDQKTKPTEQRTKGPKDQTYRTKDQRTKRPALQNKGPNDQTYRTKDQTYRTKSVLKIYLILSCSRNCLYFTRP